MLSDGIHYRTPEIITGKFLYEHMSDHNTRHSMLYSITYILPPFPKCFFREGEIKVKNTATFKFNNLRNFRSCVPALTREFIVYLATKMYWFNSLFYLNRFIEKPSVFIAPTNASIVASSRSTGRHSLLPLPRKKIKYSHRLPKLPYATSALRPFLDTRTVQKHHDIYHAANVDNLNLALKSAPHLQDKTPEWLLLHLDDVPIRIRSKVRDNAGGHLNHSMMWQSMSPDLKNTKRENCPSGPLATALDMSFGSFDNFKTKFEAIGLTLLGSGWVWLLLNSDDTLKLMTTPGHINPISLGCEPLLVVDVWEHAYYLKYLNRRDKYLNAWWSVTNWEAIEARFNQIKKSSRL